MKALLGGLGSGIGALGFVAAMPVFVTSLGAALAGLGTFGLLAYRAYRRMQRSRAADSSPLSQPGT